MNAISEHWNGEKIKAIVRAANTSKLRYPLLVLAVLLLGTVMLAARQLAAGILNDVQMIVDALNIPQ